MSGQLGARHFLFVCVDTLGASLAPPFFPFHTRFLTLYHRQYTLVCLPSSRPRPVFQHLGQLLILLILRKVVYQWCTVYDVANRESFEALPRRYSELETYVSSSVVKILVGNKVDKAHFPHFP